MTKHIVLFILCTAVTVYSTIDNDFFNECCNEKINMQKIITLLNMGADANYQCEPNQTTPLHEAARRNHAELIKLLLSRGANPNAIDSDKNTPAMLISDKKIKDIFSDTQNNPITMHVINTRASQSTLQHINVNFYDACLKGDYATVLKCISSGVEINYKSAPSNNTALHAAVLNNHENIVSTLLMHNADPNMSNYLGMTPMHVAAFYTDNHVITKLLIIFKGNMHITAPNHANATPFLLALLKKHHTVAKIFINHDQSVMYAKTASGSNALMCLAEKFDPELGETIVRYISPNEKNKAGTSSMHIAAGHDDNRYLKLLINHGGNIEIEDNNQSRPLHEACKFLRLINVKTLLNNGARVDVTNILGETPLSFVENITNNYKAMQIKKFLLAHQKQQLEKHSLNSRIYEKKDRNTKKEYANFDPDDNNAL